MAAAFGIASAALDQKENPMPKINTLHDVYVDQLKDLYSAETQLIKALPKMAKAANDETLKAGFEEHLEQTKVHAERLEEIFEELDAEWQEESEGEFEGEMDGEWLEIVQGEDANLEPLPPVLRPAERVTRYSRCGTTWDRIRHDGRVGCAYCYTTFREQLGEVMERVQRGMEHTGKQPRTALKRERRLQHLRKRRDNQLAMLQNRLRDAVAAENYEEAALLRDKIRAASTSQHD